MRQGTIEGWVITALGHDGFVAQKTENNLRIAFDPFDVKDVEPVEYIFISHHHYDHCDPNSIQAMLKPSTKIIAPESCAKELAAFQDKVVLVSDREKHTTNDLIYWTIPAYNINKYRTPTEVFHPKEKGGVGFIVEIDRFRFYHAGDTDLIPEMESLKKLSVAFLPISGTYVMTLEEAVQAAQILQPKHVIPMHFGKLLGSSSDAVRFQNLLKDKVPVTVLTAHPD